jgi:hypothetical protein
VVWMSWKAKAHLLSIRKSYAPAQTAEALAVRIRGRAKETGRPSTGLKIENADRAKRGDLRPNQPHGGEATPRFLANYAQRWEWLLG